MMLIISYLWMLIGAAALRAAAKGIDPNVNWWSAAVAALGIDPLPTNLRLVG